MSTPDPALPPTDTAPQAESELPSTAAPDTRRGNYFVRHWRGQLSLPVSYWVNGFLLTFLLVRSFTAIETSDLAEGLGAHSTGLLLLSTFLLTIACSVWQGVGVWRSADRHPSRGGSKGWATVAKVMVVLGLIRTLAYLVGHAPVIQDGMFLALGHDRTRPFQLRMVNGNQVEFSGGIPFGATDALKNLLDTTPGVRVVQLNSSGGRVSEGDRLRQLITARGLVTYTDQTCASACVLAYMGGNERYLGPSGKLGFHQASVAGMAGRSGNREGTERFRRVLLERGVRSSFVDRALATPASNMWYPSAHELLDAHVVTRIMDQPGFSSAPP